MDMVMVAFAFFGVCVCVANVCKSGRDNTEGNADSECSRLQIPYIQWADCNMIAN